MALLIRVLLTIAAIQYGVIPPIVDFTDTHVFNEAWPPHARFHMVWLVVTASLAALVVLLGCWLPIRGGTIESAARLLYACVPGWLVLSGFFLSMAWLSGFQGSLSDMAEPIMVSGIDGNVFSFSIALLIQLAASVLAIKLVKRKGG